MKPDTGWWRNEYNRLDRFCVSSGDRSAGNANYFIVFVKKTYTHAGNELYYGYGNRESNFCYYEITPVKRYPKISRQVNFSRSPHLALVFNLD